MRRAFRDAATRGVLKKPSDLLELLRDLGFNPTEAEVLDIMQQEDDDCMILLLAIITIMIKIYKSIMQRNN